LIFLFVFPYLWFPPGKATNENEHRRSWSGTWNRFLLDERFFLSFLLKEKEKLIQKKTHVRQQPMFFSFVTRSFVFILPSRWSGSRIPANQREERKTKVKS